MTPQERQLVDDLFDRLAQLESAPRDAEAERAIADGLRARAERHLSAGADRAGAGRGAQARRRAHPRTHRRRCRRRATSGGFLDTMRQALTGRSAHIGAERAPAHGGPDRAGIAAALSRTPCGAGARRRLWRRIVSRHGGSISGRRDRRRARCSTRSARCSAIMAAARSRAVPQQGGSPWDNRRHAGSDLARDAGHQRHWRRRTRRRAACSLFGYDDDADLVRRSWRRRRRRFGRRLWAAATAPDAVTAPRPWCRSSRARRGRRHPRCACGCSRTTRSVPIVQGSFEPWMR